MNTFLSGSPYECSPRPELWGVAIGNPRHSLLRRWPVWVSDQHQSRAESYTDTGCCRYATQYCNMLTCPKYNHLKFLEGHCHISRKIGPYTPPHTNNIIFSTYSNREYALSDKCCFYFVKYFIPHFLCMECYKRKYQQFVFNLINSRGIFETESSWTQQRNLIFPYSQCQ